MNNVLVGHPIFAPSFLKKKHEKRTQNFDLAETVKERCIYSLRKAKEDSLFPEKHQRSEDGQGSFVKQTSFYDPIRN